MNPYLVLGVPLEASDAEIRSAYLDGIRDFPPERSPERFQAICHAYEQINDVEKRVKYRLFDREPGGSNPSEVLFNYLQAAPRPKPPGFDSMKEFLRSWTKK